MASSHVISNNVLNVAGHYRKQAPLGRSKTSPPRPVEAYFPIMTGVLNIIPHIYYNFFQSINIPLHNTLSTSITLCRIDYTKHYVGLGINMIHAIYFLSKISLDTFELTNPNPLWIYVGKTLEGKPIFTQLYFPVIPQGSNKTGWKEYPNLAHRKGPSHTDLHRI